MFSYYQKKSKIKNDINITLTINNKNLNDFDGNKNYFNSSHYLNLTKNNIALIYPQ